MWLALPDGWRLIYISGRLISYGLSCPWLMQMTRCDCMPYACIYLYHSIAHSPMGKAEGKQFNQTVCTRYGGWPEMSH